MRHTEWNLHGLRVFGEKRWESNNDSSYKQGDYYAKEGNESIFMERDDSIVWL